MQCLPQEDAVIEKESTDMAKNDGKLTQEQQLKLRYRFLNGEDINKLAKEYGVSVSHARQIAEIR